MDRTLPHGGHRRTGVSQPFWQQGGIGEALVGQHCHRGNLVTLQAVEFLTVLAGPQQELLSQQRALAAQQETD